MDGNSDKNLTSLPANRNGSKLTFNLIDIVQNILNENNDTEKKTVEEGLLNTDNGDIVSAPNPRNCMETPKRTKRRRENEPTALDQGHHIPGSDSSDSFPKKARNKSTETEKITFPQPIGSEIKTPFRPNLKKYERMGQKPYKCGHCDYRANKSSVLAQHERIHTGEKPYKCGHCDYRASQSSAMGLHERIHTGEKPYKCSHCDYRASQSSNIRTHEKIHTGEKPYKCGHCDYRSSQSSHLRTHERAHTGEKSYKCSQCDYRASHRGNMRSHEKIHTGEKPYKCSHCDYRAILSSNVWKHERARHSF